MRTGDLPGGASCGNWEWSQSGWHCSWAVIDFRPAVRLAYCLERALKAHPRDGSTVHASCDIKMSGSYLIVLHPEGEVSDEQH